MLGRKMDKPKPMQTNQELLPRTVSKDILNDQKTIQIELKYTDTDHNRPKQFELLSQQNRTHAHRPM